MKKYARNLLEFLIITLATIEIGVCVFFFLEPSTVSIGSVSSLALVLEHFIPLPMSFIAMILNIALLIIGFTFIGKGFGIKTVYTSLLLPTVIGVCEHLFPNQGSIMGDPFLDMLVYIFTVNIGVAILFNHNASSGGLDIIAKILNKYFHIDLGQGVAACGYVVAFLSALLYEPKIVILSFLGTYLCGIILDHFIFGFNMKKRVCIISEKQEEIRQFILTQIHSGATVYQVMGAFNSELRTEIITIVDKHEYLKLMSYIEKTDKNAFVTIYNVNKVVYRANRMTHTPEALQQDKPVKIKV